MDVRYELATLENLDAVVKMQNTIFPATALKREALELCFKKGPGAGGKVMNKFYLVYVDGAMSGICSLNIPLGVEEHKSIWLNWFGILPSARGKGLGKRMLLDCIEMSKAYMKQPFNVKYFRLYTNEFGNASAQPLYNKVMELKEYYNNQEMFCKEFYEMAKNLYPGLSVEEHKKIIGKTVAIFSRRLDPENAILVPWGNKSMHLAYAAQYEEDLRQKMTEVKK